MVHLHFIVNPISGNGKHLINRSFLTGFFPKDMFSIAVSYTEYKTHAVQLAQAAVKNGADCIIACGGDGTINEVAGAIVGTNVKLGILPVGSGNGLAANLGIPRNLEKAIAILQKNDVTFIDAGKINDHYFFSNTGIGIDAMVIKKYETATKRTLPAYIKASLSASMAFQPKEALVKLNGEEIKIKPFLLFISNSNEMGYGMSLTPKASLTDGYLDVVLVPQLNFFQKMMLGYYVLHNTIYKFKPAQHSLVKQLAIELPDGIFTDVQIDGEYHNLKTNKINITVIPKGLQVIC